MPCSPIAETGLRAHAGDRVRLIAQSELNTNQEEYTMCKLAEAMDIPREYRIKMRHDRGVIVFRLFASSAKSAAERMCSLENAPKSAIVWVK